MGPDKERIVWTGKQVQNNDIYDIYIQYTHPTIIGKCANIEKPATDQFLIHITHMMATVGCDDLSSHVTHVT